MGKRRKEAREPHPRDRGNMAIALGLAAIVFARPWRDGASFPGFNTYFIWLTMVLAAFWTARFQFGETTFRSARTALPLGGFILVALLTSFDSYLPDSTYRGLTCWTASFFLFVLASNTLTTGAARGIFFAAFAATMTLSAAWALIHLRFVLPQIREMIDANPQARQYFFQSAELSPELAHRLSVNRAFGATLFPNALAAFMILAIPFLVCEFLATVTGYRAAVSRSGPERSTRWSRALLIGVGTSVALGIGGRVLLPVVFRAISGSSDWRTATVLVATIIFLLPIAAGSAITLLLRRVGAVRSWMLIQSAVLPPACILLLITLYKTYSRGAMLALFLAFICVVAILAYRRSRPRTPPARLLALLIGAAAFIATVSHAQNTTVPSEGIEVDVLSGDSFLARLDYWRVGLRMIEDHPLTGVGLGAFGAAYANYMFPGAATSQMAHNDFLQAFAETGLAGFLLFSAFWALFFAFTATRICGCPDTPTALRVAGPAAGVLAFTLHSGVDFDFANPSLAMTAFVVAGAAYARADSCCMNTVRAKPRTSALAAISFFVVIAVVTAATIRIYLTDFALTAPMPVIQKLALAGNRLEIRDKFFASKFFLEQLAAHEENPNQVMYSGYEELLRIIPNHNRIAAFATFAVPDPGAGDRYAPVSSGGPFPPGAVAVIVDADGARAALIETADALLADLEAIDGFYPYILEVSMLAYQWCDLVQAHLSDSESRRHFASLGEVWAERCVKRSPHQSAAWLAYGKSLWQRAKVEADAAAARRFYEEGLGAYRKSAEMFPSSIAAWEHYAKALEQLAKGYLEGGDAARAAQLRSERDQVSARVANLRLQWNEAG